MARGLGAAASLVGVLLLLGAWRWAGMPWPPVPSSTRHKAARVRVQAVFCSSAAAVLLGLSWAVAAYLLWHSRPGTLPYAHPRTHAGASGYDALPGGMSSVNELSGR